MTLNIVVVACCLLSFPALCRAQAVNCKPRVTQKLCPSIREKGECLTSTDPRPVFKNESCVWCLTACPNGNVCEPQKFLEDRGKEDGKDFQSCLNCKPRVTLKPCNQITEKDECL